MVAPEVAAAPIGEVNDTAWAMGDPDDTAWPVTHHDHTAARTMTHYHDTARTVTHHDGAAWPPTVMHDDDVAAGGGNGTTGGNDDSTIATGSFHEHRSRQDGKEKERFHMSLQVLSIEDFGLRNANGCHGADKHLSSLSPE